MKIDTHQHSWLYQASEFPWIDESMPALRRNCLPADVALDMQAAGVTGSVLVQARTEPGETDFLLGLSEQYPEVLGVIGWADLGAPQLHEQLLHWQQHPAFKGLRHIVQAEPDVRAWVDAAAINAGMQQLQRLKGVYEVLVFEHQMSQVLAFCARHDQHWLVLDHLGKPAIHQWTKKGAPTPLWQQGLSELAALPHVMCKLSGLVTETGWAQAQALSDDDQRHIHTCFDIALSVFGPQRLMYGSDWPVCQLAANYGVVHNLVQTWANSRLSAAEQAALWVDNAVRCYGLTLPRL